MAANFSSLLSGTTNPLNGHLDFPLIGLRMESTELQFTFKAMPHGPALARRYLKPPRAPRENTDPPRFTSMLRLLQLSFTKAGDSRNWGLESTV
jgi:hypothetical protein